MCDGEEFERGFERRKHARALTVGELVRVHLPPRVRTVQGYEYHGSPALILSVTPEQWSGGGSYLCLVGATQRSFSRPYLIAADDEEVTHGE